MCFYFTFVDGIFKFLSSYFIKGMCVVALVPVTITRRRATFQPLVIMLLMSGCLDGFLNKSFVCKIVIAICECYELYV